MAAWIRAIKTATGGKIVGLALVRFEETQPKNNFALRLQDRVSAVELYPPNHPPRDIRYRANYLGYVYNEIECKWALPIIVTKMDWPEGVVIETPQTSWPTNLPPSPRY